MPESLKLLIHLERITTEDPFPSYLISHLRVSYQVNSHVTKGVSWIAALSTGDKDRVNELSAQNSGWSCLILYLRSEHSETESAEGKRDLPAS